MNRRGFFGLLFGTFAGLVMAKQEAESKTMHVRFTHTSARHMQFRDGTVTVFDELPHSYGEPPKFKKIDLSFDAHYDGESWRSSPCSPFVLLKEQS